MSDAAAAVIRQIRDDRSGTLTITVDGGCCEGTAPHLYENYVVPAGAIEIGRVDDVPVFIPGNLGEQYATASVTIDVVDDPLADALSLETDLGKRLVFRP